MTEADKNKQFVIQQHLTMPDKGICFFTMNTQEGRDCYSTKRELWYKNVAYADTIEEAQALVAKHTEYPSTTEMYNHYLNL